MFLVSSQDFGEDQKGLKIIYPLGRLIIEAMLYARDEAKFWAQLFDFDISTDLSLNVHPQLYYDLQNQRTAEIKLAITF